MAKIPIGFQKIKLTEYNNKEVVKYLITIKEKESSFNRSIVCSRNELEKLRDELGQVLADSNTSEILGISETDAMKIEVAHSSDVLCFNCKFKMTNNCYTCIVVLQSPLERKLFLELKKSHINFQPQYALNWYGKNISIQGKSFDNPNNNFKDVLTVVDFYIEQRNIKLCVYTDGHTFHERTEEQAQRDRNIDRKLQELGYQVLRYTGKDINDNIEKVIIDVRKWIG